MTNLNETIQAVLQAVGNCDREVDEKEFHEELMSIAEGWKMRLEEIEEEEQDL